MAEGGANADELVCRHRRSHAASAQNHAPLRAAPSDCVRDRFGVVGIIVVREDFHGAAVDDQVSPLPDDLEERALEREPGMVRPYGYEHDKRDSRNVTGDTCGRI
jgi:hypothetical protein